MIELDGLRWCFEGGPWVLDGIDLRVQPGEKVLITGPSGCGKSTLLRLIAGLLPLHGAGRREGNISVEGQDPGSWGPRDRATRVGLVQQEPGAQLVGSTVEEELCFAAAQVGRDLAVREALAAVGLDVPLHADPHALSGGQQQRLAIAAARSAGAPLLLLDEPLAHLDGRGVRDLLGALDGTVILVEHRLEAAMAWADRVVVLGEGRVVYDGTSPPIGLLEGPGLTVPPTLRIEQAGGLDRLGPRRSSRSRQPIARVVAADAVVRGGVEISPARNWELAVGDRIAVLGANGVGKSTALGALAEALGDEAVWVPQQPGLSLSADTVRQELMVGPQERGVAPAVGLDGFGLEPLADARPTSLSRGQQLRLAVAASLACAPGVLLLDEPTAGQHGSAVDEVMAAVDRVLGDGVLVFATHDVELALSRATWVIVPGVGEGPPGEMLASLVLPPLQQAQAERGFPLVDVDTQLRGEPGVAGPPIQPVEPPPIPQPVRPQRAPASVAHVALLLGLGALAILLEGPVVLGALAVLGTSFLLTRPIPVRTKLGVIGLLAVVAWGTVLSQGLFYGDHPRVPLLSVGPVVVWREGIGWGLVQSARMIAVSAVGLGIAASTAPQRLTERLRSLGLPGALAFVVALALAAVPWMARSWWTARTARARRARAAWRRNPMAWIRLELSMLGPVLRVALERGATLAQSLDARGFDVHRPLPVPPLGPVDRLALGAAGVAVVLVLALRAIVGLYRLELFYDPALQPLYVWVSRWL